MSARTISRLVACVESLRDCRDARVRALRDDRAERPRRALSVSEVASDDNVLHDGVWPRPRARRRRRGSHGHAARRPRPRRKGARGTRRGPREAQQRARQHAGGRRRAAMWHGKCACAPVLVSSFDNLTTHAAERASWRAPRGPRGLPLPPGGPAGGRLSAPFRPFPVLRSVSLSPPPLPLCACSLRAWACEPVACALRAREREMDAANIILSGVDVAAQRQWRDEDREWRSEDRRWHASEVAWREEERRWREEEREFRAEQRRWHVQEATQRALDNAR